MTEFEYFEEYEDRLEREAIENGRDAYEWNCGEAEREERLMHG